MEFKSIIDNGILKASMLAIYMLNIMITSEKIIKKE